MYAADVTYVTAKEAGFDHLRDLLALDRAEVVHRPFHFALVDEADEVAMTGLTKQGCSSRGLVLVLGRPLLFGITQGSHPGAPASAERMRPD